MPKKPAANAKPKYSIRSALVQLERDWREGVAPQSDDASVLAASVDLWNWTGVQLRTELRNEYPDADLGASLAESRFRADALAKAVRLHIWWRDNVPSGPGDATFADHALRFSNSAVAYTSAVNELEKSKQDNTWLFFISGIVAQRGAMRDEDGKLALLYHHMGSVAQDLYMFII